VVPDIQINCQSQRKLLGNTVEIESIIANLLTNAIRHTAPDGQITLSWIDAGSDAAAMSVTDTGAGIAAENIPRLTERFFRADEGRSRENGGVGLGLAIVKHVLARHGAELEIESELDVGSTFTCKFSADRVLH